MILGKHPILYSNRQAQDCWAWFKDYDKPPAGMWCNLLPVPLFHAVRIAAGLRKSRNGHESYGVAFDTEKEAFEFAETAYKKLMEKDAEATLDMEDADYNKKIGLMAVPAEVGKMLAFLPPERIARIIKQNKYKPLVKIVKKLKRG